MTATETVDLLLELNILNADDARRELAQVAARIRNPIGQKWLNRVGWYALNNIDKLAEVPRKSTSTQQHQNSPDYPAFQRTDAEPSSVDIGPDESDHIHVVENSETLTELAMQYYDDPSMAEVLNKLNPKLQYDTVLKSLSFGGRPSPRPSSQPDEKRRKRVFGESAGIQKEAEFHGLDHPIAVGQRIRIPSKARLSKLGLFGRSTIPKQSRDYDTTSFNSQLWRRDIEQNFVPLKPDKKKKVSLPGDMPTAKEMPPWAAGKEGQMHHFNPVLASRRELWDDFASIAHYLNFVSAVNLEDFPEFKREQETLFRKLEMANVSNLSDFLDVLAKAREWRLEVRNNPWKFTKGDPSVVYKHKNGYAWKKMEDVGELKREGNDMNHCVGGYTHTHNFEIGATEVYSLRDMADKPHVTIEVNLNPPGIAEIKGHSNATSTLAPALKIMAREFVTNYLSGIPVLRDKESINVG